MLLKLKCDGREHEKAACERTVGAQVASQGIFPNMCTHSNYLRNFPRITVMFQLV